MRSVVWIIHYAASQDQRREGNTYLVMNGITGTCRRFPSAREYAENRPARRWPVGQYQAITRSKLQWRVDAVTDGDTSAAGGRSFAFGKSLAAAGLGWAGTTSSALTLSVAKASRRGTMVSEAAHNRWNEVVDQCAVVA